MLPRVARGPPRRVVVRCYFPTHQTDLSHCQPVLYTSQRGSDLTQTTVTYKPSELKKLARGMLHLLAEKLHFIQDTKLRGGWALWFKWLKKHL